MPPHKPARPLGRADHKRRVAAAESEIDKLLKGIASDPEAGPWRAWAAKLLKSDEGTTGARSSDRPGGAV